MCVFFKQKTAYEMRISDWSSDVCSSDRCVHRCFLPGYTCFPSYCPRLWKFFQRCVPDRGLRHPPRKIPSSPIAKRRHSNEQYLLRCRSEERRVGKESVSTCRSRWTSCHS